MTIIAPDPQLTLEECIRLHTVAGLQDGEDAVLESAREKLIEAATLAWADNPEEAARTEESLRLFERLNNE